MHSQIEFSVDAGAANSHVEVNIEGPDGKLVKNIIINNADGTYTVKYTPKIEGIHFISLTINGQKLPGGPIQTMVTDVGSVTVTSKQYEKGRNDSFIATFQIDLRKIFSKYFLSVNEKNTFKV